MKNKGMQLGAMLAAMLLVAVVFAGAAPTAPPDSVERAILGLNATEPRNEGLPDFGPEVFEKIKKDQKVLATYGKMPTIKIETEKRNWLRTLYEIRNSGRDKIDPYFYPAGPVTGYGIDYEGYLVVMFNGSSNKVLMDKIYKLLDIQAMQRGITEVPVVFESGNLPQFDVKPSSQNGETTTTSNINKTTSAQRNEISTEKSVSGFGLLGGLISMLSWWLFRKK